MLLPQSKKLIFGPLINPKYINIKPFVYNLNILSNSTFIFPYHNIHCGEELIYTFIEVEGSNTLKVTIEWEETLYFVKCIALNYSIPLPIPKLEWDLSCCSIAIKNFIYLIDLQLSLFFSLLCNKPILREVSYNPSQDIYQVILNSSRHEYGLTVDTPTMQLVQQQYSYRFFKE